MIPPLEAFADGIMHHEGWVLGSRSWRNRNPGNLRPTHAGQEQDAQGYRVFPSLVDGYAALLAELRCKFTGANTHGIGPSSTLSDLIAVYAPWKDANNPLKYTAFMAGWLSAALGRQVFASTPLHEIWPGCINSTPGTKA